MSKTIKSLTAAAILAFAAPLGAAAQTSQPISFTLTNKTQHPLTALYISRVSADDWNQDIFGDTALDPGASVEVTIDDNLEACEYDVKASFDGGDDVILSGRNFCKLDGGSITLSE